MAAAQPETFDAVASGMRAFGAIALVLALLCVLAWLARRGTLRLPGPKGRAAIKVEGATSLGERRTLVVVTIEGRRLLLGLTPGQVSLVTELSPDPPDFGKTLDSRIAPPPAPGTV